MEILSNIGFAFFVILIGLFLISLVLMLFDDTETFKAIDEKIAKLIKGKEVE